MFPGEAPPLRGRLENVLCCLACQTGLIGNTAGTYQGAKLSYTTPIAVTGLVATTPRHLVTQDGLPITSFRLASSTKRFDEKQGKIVEETNWFTVTSFKTLAINAAGSISKGDRIMVSGVICVRDWDNGERAGTSVEIEAEAIGHDIYWGTSQFTRTVLTREDRPELIPVI